jgi:methyltransferase
MVFIFFITFIVVLRIAELLLSKRNERWLLQQGAVEYGKKHYYLIVVMHVLFIISLLLEYDIIQPTQYSTSFLVLYLVLLVLKAWVISSLGSFWNTKIFHISKYPLVKNGPYKYIKHPNYIIVIAEIAVIPLIFHLFYTAVIFTLLNAIILSVRIAEENKALEL